MELLKDVLIKEVTDRGVDEVFIIDNLPKNLLFRRAPKMMIDYTDIHNRQNLIKAFEVLDNGSKRFTGEMTDELLPGVEKSDNEENCYVFFTELNSAKDALASVDRYVAMTMPVAERVPNRIPYAAQPGNHNSAPVAYNKIPRVVLPTLVSPPAIEAAQAPDDRVLGEGHIPQAPADRRIPDPSVATRDRMAKARAAKAAKASNK